MKKRWVWTGLILLALVPRLLLIALRVSHGTGPEAFEFEDVVHNLLAGHGYMHLHHDTPYRSFHTAFPYVFLTALVYRLSGFSHPAMLVVQSLAGGILAVVACALGRRVGGGRAGWIAGVLVALHPGLVYYDTHKLHPLSIDALALASAVLALSWWLTRPSLRRAALAGLLASVAFLERASFAPVMAASLIVLWSRVKEPPAVFKQAVVFLLCGSLLVGPWLLRNVRLHGRLILMTTSGEHLWRGNNPNATGSSLTPEGDPILERADPAFRAALLRRDELGQMDLFLSEARRYIAQHPWRFVQNVSTRCLTFAWFGPMSGWRYPRSYLRAYQAYYVLVLALAGVGLGSLWRRWARLDGGSRITTALLVGTWLSVGLAQSLFYVEIRHRWAVESLMLVLAAFGLMRLVVHPQEPAVS